MSGIQALAAVLGAGGLGAVLAAMITGLFSKRKLGAEATEIITKAAAGVVTNLQAEIDRQVKARRDEAELHRSTTDQLIVSHRREMSEFHRALDRHVAWDRAAIERLAEVGIIMPEAPPALPPLTDI